MKPSILMIALFMASGLLYSCRTVDGELVSRQKIQTSCQGYCDEKTFETCPSGTICCLEPIVVTPKYQPYIDFTTIVETRQPDKIRDYFVGGEHKILFAEYEKKDATKELIKCFQSGIYTIWKHSLGRGNTFMVGTDTDMKNQTPKFKISFVNAN